MWVRINDDLIIDACSFSRDGFNIDLKDKAGIVTTHTFTDIDEAEAAMLQIYQEMKAESSAIDLRQVV